MPQTLQNFVAIAPRHISNPNKDLYSLREGRTVYARHSFCLRGLITLDFAPHRASGEVRRDVGCFAYDFYLAGEIRCISSLGEL